MARLQYSTAEEIVHIVELLKSRASFRGVWLEARRRGIVEWDRTLRKYLDLLVPAGVLRVDQKDVGSVYPKQLYTVASRTPRIAVGLRILQEHGLNWQVPEGDFWYVNVDYEALVRSKKIKLGNDVALGACLEDCLVFETKRDVEGGTGLSELVLAILATTRLDMPYLLRRADSLEMGVTLRHLYQRIEKILTGLPAESEGRLFLQVRDRFLKIARQYSRLGVMGIVRRAGKGRLGLETIIAIREAVVINAAAKQLGLTG